MCFRGFSLKTTEKHRPKALQAEGQVWRQLMVFHLRELRKCSQQSPGSAAKLLQANQLKHHSLGDRSEQSNTVWIFFFFHKKSFRANPLFPHKESSQPLQRKPAPGHRGAPAAAHTQLSPHKPSVSWHRNQHLTGQPASALIIHPVL